MVSLSYLITIVSALAAVSVAEEVTHGEQENEVDAKWFGRWGSYGGFSSYSYYASMGWGMGGGWLNNWSSSLYGGCYAYSLLGGMYNGLLFAKASDAATSISRRAISLDSEQLLSRRGADNELVQCKNEKGETHTFSTSECINAAHQLSEKQLSTASSGSCKLTIVSPKTRVQPKDVSPAALEKATRVMLKACAESKNVHDHPAASKGADEKQVAMLLSKA
ncbi:uncharacterized protein VP01_1862g6 [Puccinia sorghi]|uniref:Uncharacterized protein n=1 Tax=Puccinia sorghi TaxID=27349 RepID=A0A0L6VDY9_9BASI|nr:uncharacterized protein VP01_1862g6 [Puccinia sorghi]